MSESALASMLPDWPRVSGEPSISARIRTRPEDFQVDEELGFEPDGEGEHLLVNVRKRCQNTADVAQILARHAGVKIRDVGYCGLKDRNAVTTQWFSVGLPGKPDPDWDALENENLQIIRSCRHRRKLQRGALRGNRFTIVLRDFEYRNKYKSGYKSGYKAQDAPEKQKHQLTIMLSGIKKQGVPNYFGAQRFGRGGQNINSAIAMFQGRKIKSRHLRGLYLSAARSFLFNEVLAARIKAGNWDQAMPGEALMLRGSRSYFVAETIDEEIKMRLASGDVLPSGPLWGSGGLPSQDEAHALENAALSQHIIYREGLEQAGLKQERRALRLPVADLQWSWLSEGGSTAPPENSRLQLKFYLPAGSYATSVLRELLDFNN